MDDSPLDDSREDEDDEVACDGLVVGKRVRVREHEHQVGDDRETGTTCWDMRLHHELRGLDDMGKVVNTPAFSWWGCNGHRYFTGVIVKKWYKSRWGKKCGEEPKYDVEYEDIDCNRLFVQEGVLGEFLELEPLTGKQRVVDHSEGTTPFPTLEQKKRSERNKIETNAKSPSQLTSPRAASKKSASPKHQAASGPSNGASAAAGRKVLRKLSTAMARNVHRMRPVDLFKGLDLGRSGSVSQEELQAGLKRMGLERWSDDEARQLLLALDANGDGKISMRELREGLEAHEEKRTSQVAHHCSGRSWAEREPCMQELEQEKKKSLALSGLEKSPDYKGELEKMYALCSPEKTSNVPSLLDK
jgi:hypothetical protein